MSQIGHFYKKHVFYRKSIKTKKHILVIVSYSLLRYTTSLVLFSLKRVSHVPPSPKSRIQKNTKSHVLCIAKVIGHMGGSNKCCAPLSKHQQSTSVAVNMCSHWPETFGKCVTTVTKGSGLPDPPHCLTRKPKILYLFTQTSVKTSRTS